MTILSTKKLLMADLISSFKNSFPSAFNKSLGRLEFKILMIASRICGCRALNSSSLELFLNLRTVFKRTYLRGPSVWARLAVRPPREKAVHLLLSPCRQLHFWHSFLHFASGPASRFSRYL